MPAPVPAPAKGVRPPTDPAVPDASAEPEEIGRARSPIATLVFLSAYLWVLTDPLAEFLALGAAALSPLLLSRGPAPASWGIVARVIDANSSLVVSAVVAYELLDHEGAGLPLWAIVSTQAFMAVYAIVAVVKAQRVPDPAPHAAEPAPTDTPR